MDVGFSERRGWYTVSVLCLLYMLSYIDRSALGVMATGVSASLGLSDTQLSLVVGLGFAMVYAAAGIPIAHWMDNGNRRWGLIAGVLVWSTATTASSFAGGFWQLLACRAGVAIGEAVLTPAAVSLIADMFARNRRAAPMTCYSAVGAVMGMGSLAGAAAALWVGDHLSESLAMEPWRIALLVLGIPGVALALLILLTVKEPVRTEAACSDIGQGGSVRDLIRYLSARRAFFIPFYAGAGISSLFPLAVMLWSPTLLVREHGFGQAPAGYSIGVTGMILSLGGTLVWPRLAKFLEGRAPGRGAVLAIACAGFVALLSVFGPLSADSRIVILGVSITMACFAAWSILPALIIQRLVPSRMRARTIALHLFFISTIGSSFGPLLAVRFASAGLGPDQLSMGLFKLGAITTPIAILCYLFCARAAPVVWLDAPGDKVS